MVKLHEGQKIRIEEVGTGKTLKKNKRKIGVIARRYKKYIRIQFEKIYGKFNKCRYNLTRYKWTFNYCKREWRLDKSNKGDVISD